MKRLRESGPNHCQFDLPDGVRSSNSTEDVFELSSTDLRLIVRALATNNYVYVISPGQSEGHWESYEGAHTRPLAPAVFLALTKGSVMLI